MFFLEVEKQNGKELKRASSVGALDNLIIEDLDECSSSSCGDDYLEVKMQNSCRVSKNEENCCQAPQINLQNAKKLKRQSSLPNLKDPSQLLRIIKPKGSQVDQESKLDMDPTEFMMLKRKQNRIAGLKNNNS